MKTEIRVSVVYPIFSTSNHNREDVTDTDEEVVYPIFSTSNHNLSFTTGFYKVRCISYLFYIKPQRKPHKLLIFH